VAGSAKVFTSAMSQISGAVNQYHPIALNSKINTAGIFNTVRYDSNHMKLHYDYLFKSGVV